jgi:hypothetical protein
VDSSKYTSVLVAASLLACAATNTNAEEHRTDRDNVIWTVPSKDAAGSMPLGNGELGINLWVEENGDLLFYLSRNDSYSEVSQLCKVGKVRVSLSPNPFTTGAPFRQELKLSDGVCDITAGKPEAQVQLKVFVDAAHPVVHVVGKSRVPTTITTKVESWRTEKAKPHSSWTLMGNPEQFWQSADVFPVARPNSVSWYHRNETSPAFESTIKLQSLEPIRESLRDSILHRTFGGWITGAGFKSTDDRTLTTSAVKNFSLRVASPSSQTATAEEWLNSAEALAKKTSDAAAALSRTTALWRSFWDRSWVICEQGLDPQENFPTNDLPLLIGVGSNNNEKFQGTIGAASVLGRPISANEIAALAAQAPKVDPTPDLQAPEFKEGFTLEAWIKPDAAKDGRIFDKSTPGKPDGFLFDTHPGNSLRLMVGSKSLSSPGKILKLGEWQHVAATFHIETGALEIFLNGKSIAKHGANTVYPERDPVNIGRAHTLQRYMQACAGRGGDFPIKFNGSIFTVEPAMMGKKEDPDFRRWGDCNWWQNIRMPYHAMQAAGDFDLMMPFFNMFESYRVFGEARTKLYYNAEGCFFAETMTPWGTYANSDYGWDRTGKEPRDVNSVWVRFVWNQGLEVVALMLDYYEHTGDKVFLEKRLLPMATSVLKYFDTRFRKDADGRVVLDPTQSVETYRVATNDTPCVAGLNDITARLCALPATAMSPNQRAYFQKMKAAAPTIPIEDGKLGGQTVRKIAVAQTYKDERSNGENPELFVVWPFRLAGLERPLLEEARNAYQLRHFHQDVGWGYDGNAAALLGMTDEAARILKVKIANSHSNYRWPATWGPNFDWLPDQCHGGNLMATINYMLLQHSGERILLLPAWPKDWDVSFKLHAPRQTTVECVYRGGKIEKLEVNPPSRRKNVQLPTGLQAP